MKNSAKFVLTLALTVASAASCHKEIAVQGEGSAELTLNPQVDVLTKAPIAGTTFPNERTIVLSAAYHNGSGSSANYFQDVTFERDASKNAWVGMNGTNPNPKYWPVSGSLDLLAYSADGFTNALTTSYATKCSEYVILTVPSENNTKQVDILFAGATDKSASGSALSMQFKHAEAVVAFDAKADVAYNGTKNLGVTINNITLNNVNSAGKVRLPVTGDCTWSDLATTTNIVLPGISSGYNVPTNYIHNTATKPFAIGNTGLIVIPQAATSFTVNYTVHYGKDSSSDPINKDETFTYDIPSATWAAGKEYVYQLYFKQDQILVNSTILNWDVIPNGATVPDKVSATFKDPGKTDIDLCSSGVPAKLSAGAIVGFDWGDGRYEIIENTTASEMILNSIPHSYPTPPSKSVNIYVRRGTLDFGKLKPEYFDLFNVYKDTEVILNPWKFTINKAEATYGSFTVSQEEAYAGETITISPSPNTNYEVNEVKYNDGSDHPVSPVSEAYSFTMPAADVTVTVTFKESATGTIGGHDYVKIGNTKWATCNVGADSPTEYGWYFSWGNTQGYTYDSSKWVEAGTTTTYSGGFSSSNYNSTSGKGLSSNIPANTIYDAACKNWGGTWRMPTAAEFKDLYDACWTGNIGSGSASKTQQGIYWCSNYQGSAGLLFCDGSGNQLFFPAAGYGSATSRSEPGSRGYYWSSNQSSSPYFLTFHSSDVTPNNYGTRYYGRSVRPVSN